MRHRDEKIDLLRELPLFAGAHRRDLRQLAAATDLVRADAGRVLCRAGRRALETFIVVDGMVDLVVQGTTVASLQRGQIVGELDVIDAEPRSADVVAATDVTLLDDHHVRPCEVSSRRAQRSERRCSASAPWHR